MNPIKKFFKDKKKELNFKKAGPGRKLTDDGPMSSRAGLPAQVMTSSAARRQPPTDVAKRAAEAALARAEQKSTPVNWSLAAIRAQAKKELELELQAEHKAKQEPKEVFQESCPLLAVSGVYFHCPLIGPHVATHSEIQVKIKEFLNEQLEEERGLTSCLILHSCNKDKERVKVGVETLSKYLTNIIDNPTEEKYRKIRLNNKVFKERVAYLEGAHDFLLAAGFQEQTVKTDNIGEDYFVFPEENLAELENLQMLKDALLSAEPIRPVLDRNKKVLMPSQVTERISLPNDFYNLSKEELMREQEARTEAVEVISQLRTKAMRERDSIKELRIYRYTLVRIRFPDGIILQGTFSVHEKLVTIKEFIVDNLAQSTREFVLLAPGAFKLTEDDSSLLDLKLVPAVLLNLQWVMEDHESTNEVAYLKSETMCLLQDI